MKLALLFVPVAVAAAPRISPQRVLDDYTRAMGGAKALSRIETESLAGNLTEDATGKTGTYARIVKAPRNLYSEWVLEPEHEITAYNGRSPWSAAAPGGAHTLTGDDAKQAVSSSLYWNSHLADAKNSRFTLQWIGVEQVHGRDADHLRVTLSNGGAQDVFFDAQSHLIVRESTPTEQVDYEDYRPAGGIPVAFRMKILRGSRQFTVTLTRAEIDMPVEDSVFDFPPARGAPLPDIRTLLDEVNRNQKGIDELQKEYTCHVRTELFPPDSKGASKGASPAPKVFEAEVFHIDGEEVRHRVAIDGKPLEGAQKRKADEDFNKRFARLTRQEAEHQADPKKQARQEAEDEKDLSTVLSVIQFTNPRRERFRGADVIAVDFSGKPGVKPKGLLANFVSKLEGVVWNDDQAHDMVRLEAHLGNTMKVAGGLVGGVAKGSAVVLEQAKVNDEVWLPTYQEIHLSVRLLMLHGNANRIERYSDCKKFRADSTFTVGQN